MCSSTRMNSRESRALFHKCDIKIARKGRLEECRYQNAEGDVACCLIEMSQRRPKWRLSSQRSGKNAVEHGQQEEAFKGLSESLAAKRCVEPSKTIRRTNRISTWAEAISRVMFEVFGILAKRSPRTGESTIL